MLSLVTVKWLVRTVYRKEGLRILCIFTIDSPLEVIRITRNLANGMKNHKLRIQLYLFRAALIFMGAWESPFSIEGSI